MWWWIIGALVLWVGYPLLMGRALRTLAEEAGDDWLAVADPADGVADSHAPAVPLADGGR